ncbi:acetate--CoA ligase family protein [Hyperthermus butylicus]|uniref:Conserved archaeal protein n=1 Tax=Hyperthermus butylicus (strain DSM 5456 / JCM 9403 / PLM1-5) TaxID=415426 RepID=A2BMF5_HYPBU|nr:acetate--CoA ligase family protein [Hyperthermus butylicus]ABM81166.1 conserved archaeal protein [Hyperthermus butylicus DSM 5456]
MGSAKDVLRKALEEGRKKLLEHEAYAVAEAYGLPVPRYGLARDPDEAARLSREIGFPVVLKIVSPDITHKSDVGGVILDIRSEDDARKAFTQIIENVKKHAPEARIAGVLIQEMVPSDLEVIVGATRDQIFGPLLMFGLGGIFVEVLKDVSFRLAPVTPIDAEEMIKEIKAYRILEGYRGKPPRDIEALKDIIVKTSKLMLENPEIQDIDLNPIMVFEKGKGAKIADIRIILRSEEGR